MATYWVLECSFRGLRGNNRRTNQSINILNWKLNSCAKFDRINIGKENVKCATQIIWYCSGFDIFPAISTISCHVKRIPEKQMA